MAGNDPVGKDPSKEEIKVPKTPASGIEKLNLSQARVRRRHMLGSEISIKWDSYTAKATALCSQLVSKVASDAGSSKRPDKFNVGTKKEFPGDIFMEPTIEPDESTIQARWSKRGMLSLDLERLLTVRPLSIPQGMRGHYEVSRHETPSGPVVRLHFGKPRYAEITRTGKRKKDNQQQGSNRQQPSEKPQGPDKPQDTSS